MEIARQVGRLIGLIALALVSGLGVFATATAQDVSTTPVDLTGPYVSIYQGSCDDELKNPIMDIGFMERVGYYKAIEEIHDGSNVGDNPAGSEIAEGTPAVWKAENEVSQDFDELLGGDLALAVKQSDDPNDTTIACGEFQDNDWDDEGRIVVSLNMKNDSGFYGFAIFEQDTGDVPVFGDNSTGVTVYLFENFTTLRQERQAQGTPTP